MDRLKILLFLGATTIAAIGVRIWSISHDRVQSEDPQISHGQTYGKLDFTFLSVSDDSSMNETLPTSGRTTRLLIHFGHDFWT